MTNISFDREAVGIVEKAQWTAAEDLAQVGASVGNLMLKCYSYPEEASAGTNALDKALSDFKTYMSWAVLEYSDACSVLGSGIADYAQDADSTETYNREKARAAASRLGVEGEL